MKINLHRTSSTLLAPTSSFNIPSQHPRDSIVLKILTAVITAETIKIQTTISTVTYNFHRVRTRWSISHRQSSVRLSLSACIAAGVKCLGHATAGDRSPGHLIRVPRVFSRNVSRICTMLSGHFCAVRRASRGLVLHFWVVHGFTGRSALPFSPEHDPEIVYTWVEPFP